MSIKEKIQYWSSFYHIAGRLLPAYFETKLESPVFIIGSGRSGTTFLTKVLSKHPEITTYPDEANELWHPELYPYHKSNLEVAPVWIEPLMFTEKSLSTWPVNWEKRIKGIFGAYFAMNEKPVFLQKTVMTNFMLEKKLELFPKARFIHLFRNGLSVVLSYQKKELDKYQHSRYQKYIDPQDFKMIRNYHAEYWNSIILQVENFKKHFGSGSNFIELRYEELTKNPRSSIDMLLQFIGLDMSSDTDFQEIITQFENRNYKAQNELQSDEIKHLREIMKKGLEMKGY